MNTLSLRRFLLISLAGHIAVSALFGFSFYPSQNRLTYAPVVYMGELPGRLFTLPVAGVKAFPRLRDPLSSGAGFLPERSDAPVLSAECFIKPGVPVPAASNKSFVPAPAVITHAPVRQDSVLILHPLLPYQFDLYFKDRQTVNIEHEFMISRVGGRSLVNVRRSISSGNLEADLLSIRSISHYLYIQEERFVPDVWQKVKIEFSPGGEE